jgi:hypothetical protein
VDTLLFLLEISLLTVGTSGSGWVLWDWLHERQTIRERRREKGAQGSRSLAEDPPPERFGKALPSARPSSRATTAIMSLFTEMPPNADSILGESKLLATHVGFGRRALLRSCFVLGIGS